LTCVNVLVIFDNKEPATRVESLFFTKTQASLERDTRRGQSDNLWNWLIRQQEESVTFSSSMEIVSPSRAGSFDSLWINLTCVDVLIIFYNREYIIRVESLLITETQAFLERDARRGQLEDLSLAALGTWLIRRQEVPGAFKCPIEIVPPPEITWGSLVVYLQLSR